MALDLTRLFQVEVEHYETMEGRSLSLQGTATRLAAMIRGNLPLAARVVAAHLVDEPPGRDRHQPAARVVRHLPGPPLHGGGEDGLLHRVLTPLELAVPAYQHLEDLRRELTQQVLDG